MTHAKSVRIGDPSAVGEARRVATALAFALGFDETLRGKIAIAANELANNILAHARVPGEILFVPGRCADTWYLDVFALDKGAGMADVERCLVDGYSTGSTSSNGLGAVRSLSQAFDLHSLPEKGTAVFARFSPPLPSGARADFPEGLASPRGLKLGCIRLALESEAMCGDDWTHVHGMARGEPFETLLLADGLGHGPLALEAARAASDHLEENPTLSPAAFLKSAHERLRPTRGAAVAVATIHATLGCMEFSGIGNVSTRLITKKGTRGLVSFNGIVGKDPIRVQELSYPWECGNILVLHTDGLSSSWNPASFPGLFERDPALIAAVLFRDLRRTRDDAAILVAADS